MRFACRVTKPRIQTHIHSVWYLLLFLANSDYMNVPLLCYMYIAWLVISMLHMVCIYNLKNQQDPKTYFTVAVLAV